MKGPIVRKFAKNGAVTIPTGYRKELGLEPGQRFNIELMPNGTIILNPIDIHSKSDRSTPADSTVLQN